MGFAAALSDGVPCAHLTLLEVLPPYRRCGIGCAGSWTVSGTGMRWTRYATRTSFPSAPVAGCGSAQRRCCGAMNGHAAGPRTGRRPAWYNRTMEVVGHRGCAGILPENTLLGFRHAIALGVDRVECDVHRTRDEHLVVMHDERVDRTTDGTGPIALKSLAEVRALDAGQGQRVPTLDEVLEVVAGARMRLLLELKGAGTAAPALAAVARRDLLSLVTFTCFDLTRIDEVRRLEAAARTGAIFSRADAASAAVARDAGAVAMGVQFRFLTAEVVAAAHAFGLEIRAWNPDSEQDQRATIALQPDGISTNRPDRLLGLLGRVPGVS